MLDQPHHHVLFRTSLSENERKRTVLRARYAPTKDSLAKHLSQHVHWTSGRVLR
jgi:hypothetical protein